MPQIELPVRAIPLWVERIDSNPSHSPTEEERKCTPKGAGNTQATNEPRPKVSDANA